jgi:hypothetical protein
MQLVYTTRRRSCYPGVADLREQRKATPNHRLHRSAGAAAQLNPVARPQYFPMA